MNEQCMGFERQDQVPLCSTWLQVDINHPKRYLSGNRLYLIARYAVPSILLCILYTHSLVLISISVAITAS
jgi:hypothetical protein